MIDSVALRAKFRAIATFGTALAVLFATHIARAQTFPQDPQWVPLTCDGQVATDPAGNVQPAAMDVVGDATHPAAYVFMDATWLYLRLRIADTVLQSATTYDPYAWACLIRTPSTPGGYLLWNGVDGIANPNDVELLRNTTAATGNPTQQHASEAIKAYGVTANARQATATSQLGGNPNFFIDWAVALSDIATVGITPSTPVTFICGTSTTDGVLNGDVVSESQACGGVLDGVLCTGGACATCSTASACGPDCVSCSDPGQVCNPLYGCAVTCTGDAQCGGATPVCDTGSGMCVGCTSDASCGPATTCDASIGLCVGCTAVTDCPSGTYCDTTTQGTCVPCADGSMSCGDGTASGSGYVVGQGTIEGGSCACDVVGGTAPTGGLAGLALGLAAALSIRARRSSR